MKIANNIKTLLASVIKSDTVTYRLMTNIHVASILYDSDLLLSITN